MLEGQGDQVPGIQVDQVPEGQGDQVAEGHGEQVPKKLLRVRIYMNYQSEYQSDREELYVSGMIENLDELYVNGANEICVAWATTFDTRARPQLHQGQVLST